jgi:hypothetical protein
MDMKCATIPIYNSRQAQVPIAFAKVQNLVMGRNI